MREYRKKKLALTEEDAWNILETGEATYGFLGLHGLKSESDYPYVVPMNFAAERTSNSIYVHTTLDEESKRNLSIAENPNVSFAVVEPSSKVLKSPDGLACKYSMSFISVMAFGVVEIVEAPAEKARILNLLMKQKSGVENFIEVIEQLVGITKIFRIDVKYITASKKN